MLGLKLNHMLVKGAYGVCLTKCGELGLWAKRPFPTIVLFHNDFSPSGEQPEQRILAHKLQQPTAGYVAIFHKYCCRGYYNKFDSMKSLNHWGYIADVSQWQDMGIWSMD